MAGDTTLARRQPYRTWSFGAHRRAWSLGLAALALVLWCLCGALFPSNVAARVLFSETANCTPAERLLVAGVMQNRMGLSAFGGANTMNGVVRQPGAFSCIGDAGNANWRKTARPSRMTPAERRIWQQCRACVNGYISPPRGPSGRLLVYYHDKSIATPAGWNNDRWRAVRELSTRNFVFYSIVRQPR